MDTHQSYRGSQKPVISRIKRFKSLAHLRNKDFIGPVEIGHIRNEVRKENAKTDMYYHVSHSAEVPHETSRSTLKKLKSAVSFIRSRKESTAAVTTEQGATRDLDRSDPRKAQTSKSSPSVTQRSTTSRMYSLNRSSSSKSLNDICRDQDAHASGRNPPTAPAIDDKMLSIKRKYERQRSKTPDFWETEAQRERRFTPSPSTPGSRSSCSSLTSNTAMTSPEISAPFDVDASRGSGFVSLRPIPAQQECAPHSPSRNSTLGPLPQDMTISTPKLIRRSQHFSTGLRSDGLVAGRFISCEELRRSATNVKLTEESRILRKNAFAEGGNAEKYGFGYLKPTEPYFDTDYF